MRKLLLILSVMILLSACASKTREPKLSLFSLDDNNYPCTSVKFPDQIKYDYYNVNESADNVGLIYYLSLPGYKVEIAKLYSKTKNWNIESLDSVNSDISKVYSIVRDDEPDKSAVITIENIDGDLYLKGSVADYLQNDIALRVDIFKVIKKNNVFKRDMIENWKNSQTGVKNIANMREIVDYVFDNINTIDCSYKDSIDMDWWRK